MGRVLRRFGNRGTDIKRMRERGGERSDSLARGCRY